MKHIVLLISVFSLAGCQSTTVAMKVAKCKGPPFALNPQHWQPAEDEVKSRSQTVPAAAPAGGQAPSQDMTAGDQEIQIFDPGPSDGARDGLPTFHVPSLEHKGPLTSDTKAEPQTGNRR